MTAVCYNSCAKMDRIGEVKKVMKFSVDNEFVTKKVKKNAKKRLRIFGRLK